MWYCCLLSFLVLSLFVKERDQGRHLLVSCLQLWGMGTGLGILEDQHDSSLGCYRVGVGPTKLDRDVSMQVEGNVVHCVFKSSSQLSG